jgi:hypothetical protein
MKNIEARHEADFQHWWRESRNHVRSARCQDAPSAKERMDALKQRVAAKVASSGGGCST